MTEQELRDELTKILDAHDDALSAIRVAHDAMKQVWDAHDAALVSAIEANRAAIRVFNRVKNEGVNGK